MRRWWGPVLGIGLIAALPVPTALAWGPQAHRVIALIADRVLQQNDPAARAKLVALLASDKSKLTKTDIASEATWADVLREKSEEARSATANWHVARLKADSPDLKRDCFGRKPLPEGYPASHGPADNCVVDKVLQFEAELQNAETSPFERLAAVQFLLNLVGDLHDPLHTIDHGDRGGDCVALQIGTKPPVRLSTYWQATLAGEVAGGDAAKTAARLAAELPAGAAAKWAEGNPEAWAQETYEVAKSIVYSFAGEQPAEKVELPATPGQPAPPCGGPISVYKVAADYEAKAAAAVKQQLQKAGIRLAAVLRSGVK